MTRYNARTGVALQLLPGRDECNWASLRLFTERNRTISQGQATARTGASVRLTPWWGGGATFYSAGVGVSLLDGFMRIDLARGLSSVQGGMGARGPGKAGWQIHLRADSVS